MKKTTIALGLVLAIAAAALFVGATQLAAEDPAGDVVTQTFDVEGMTCGGCEVAVRAAVGKLDGIEKVTASHEEGTAEVTYDPDQVTTEAIVEAIKKLGYAAEPQAEDSKS